MTFPHIHPASGQGAQVRFRACFHVGVVVCCVHFELACEFLLVPKDLDCLLNSIFVARERDPGRGIASSDLDATFKDFKLTKARRVL